MLEILVKDNKIFPEVQEQLGFDSKELGFNYDSLIIEWLKENLGMECEPLEVI